jgi:ATP-dependent DNA helicase DinG
LTTDELFSPDGIIARSKAGYEVREGQVEMARRVQIALEEDGVLVVEAGTGIGKSFAYLIPSLLWCAQHEDERIVIATSAIPLQHQLLENDIPFLTNALNLPLSAAVLKGRSNYLCMRRLEQQMELGAGLDSAHNQMMRKLFIWSKTTKTGDRAELTWTVPQHIWRSVCSTPESCVGYYCSHREGCFVQQARRRASDAQVIIVNHHLLFASIEMNQDSEDDEHLILPEFERLIIDEAHNIERNAVSYFTQSFDPRQLSLQIHSLAGIHHGKPTGLIERIRGISADPLSCDSIYASTSELLKASDAFSLKLDTLSQDLKSSKRIERIHLDNRPEISLAGAELIEKLKDTADLLGEIISSCTETPETISTLFEAQAIFNSLREYSFLIAHLLSFDLEEDHVYWIEQRGMNGNTSANYVLNITPISFADMLSEHIFHRFRSVICTSATLTVKDTFTYWEQKVGLTDMIGKRYEKAIITSPFDYRSRVMLALAGKSPNPSDYQSYFAYSAKAIVAMIKSLEGGALVLFTSHAMLEGMYKAVGPELEQLGITLLKQGDHDRYKLMKMFVDHEHSVLMATQSFWEGVDAPGTTLRLLIICRLPFQSPADPLFAAKAAKLEQEGKSSFFGLSLPEAVIRMKQGYGRLMRTSSDRGVVCVLDSRIVTKGYGRTILASLPETLTVNGDIETLIERMENFYFTT